MTKIVGSGRRRTVAAPESGARTSRRCWRRSSWSRRRAPATTAAPHPYGAQYGGDRRIAGDPRLEHLGVEPAVRRRLRPVSTSTPPHRRSDGPHAKPEDIRFGLYGALAHPIEANAIGGCTRRDKPCAATIVGADARPAYRHGVSRAAARPVPGARRLRVLAAGADARTPRRPTPRRFRSACCRPNENDTGLVLKTTSVDAFRADGAQLDPSALGDPNAFSGNGYMLLGLEIDGLAARYRDDSARRGGPMMVLAAPTLPAPGLSHACDIYGASVLVLARRIARRRPGPRVAVHAGRDQRGIAVRVGVDWSAPTPDCGPHDD